MPEKKFRVVGGNGSTARRLIPSTSDLAEFDTRMRSFVDEKPFLAVGLAVLAGYVLGRTISRLA